MYGLVKCNKQQDAFMIKPPAWPTLKLADLRKKKSSDFFREAFLSGHLKFTYSGRAGIFQYLSALARSTKDNSRNTVLLPAFHCPTVVDPVLHANFKVRFYSVSEVLQVDPNDFLRKLDKDVAAVLFIRYFGIGEISKELIAASRACGAKVIHDCSHSFLKNSPLSLSGIDADAAIYSFWKLLPSATVGGGVWCEDEAVNRCWQLQFPVPLEKRFALNKKLLAEVKDSLFDFPQDNDSFNKNKSDLPLCPAISRGSAEAYPYDQKLARVAIPELPLRILRCADLQCVAEFRRQNYELFVKNLVNQVHLKVLFQSLKEDDVPWGVPIILNRRGERDYLLRARGVPVFTFGEVLHPLLFDDEASDTAMVSVARYLSENLLGIAVHQQLSQQMMRDYVRVTNQFIAELR